MVTLTRWSEQQQQSIPPLSSGEPCSADCSGVCPKVTVRYFLIHPPVCQSGLFFNTDSMRMNVSLSLVDIRPVGSCGWSYSDEASISPGANLRGD